MPGINTTGNANTNDYILPKGKVYFGLIDDTTGLVDASGLRYLGNAPSMSVSVEVESTNHQNSFNCLAFTDAVFVTAQTLNLSMTLDEINFQNLADFFSGATSTYDNPHDTTFADVVVTDSIVQGRWYELRDDNGARVYNLDAAGVVYVIHNDTPANAVEGTDYIVDEQLGLVQVIVGSTVLAAGDQMEFDISTGASTPKNLDEVNAFSRSSVVGTLLLVEENANDCGQKFEHRFHKVRLTGDGELPLIGNEQATMSFSGVAEINSLVNAASPVTSRTYDMV